MTAGGSGRGSGRTRQHGHATALDEALIAERLALAPLFGQLSRILGQAAGLLLLAEVGRLSSHLPSIKAQIEDARERFASLPTTGTLSESAAAAGQALAALQELVAILARRPAGTLVGDGEFSATVDRLAAIRRDLQAASRPSLGIGLVDLAGACCAWGH